MCAAQREARTSLAARGGGDPRVDELRQAVERIVACLLEAARIDDVHAVGDGDRGLGDVRGNDHLALAVRWHVEDPKLLLRRERRVKRQRQQPRLQRALRGERCVQRRDLVHARHEDEDRTRAARRVEVRHQRMNGVDVDFLLVHNTEREGHVLRVPIRRGWSHTCVCCI